MCVCVCVRVWLFGLLVGLLSPYMMYGWYDCMYGDCMDDDCMYVCMVWNVIMSVCAWLNACIQCIHVILDIVGARDCVYCHDCMIVCVCVSLCVCARVIVGECV